MGKVRVASSEMTRGIQGLNAFDTYRLLTGNTSATFDEYLAAIKGDPFRIDASGTYAEITEYAGDASVTYYFATDNGNLYVRSFDTGQFPSEEDGTPLRGPDGRSAYSIALTNGFTGSVGEWLESLRGEKGDTGETGKSALDLYREQTGNSAATMQDLLDSIAGEDGQSTLELYREQTENPEATADEFLASLVGKGLTPKGSLTSINDYPATPDLGDTYLIAGSLHVFTEAGWVSTDLGLTDEQILAIVGGSGQFQLSGDYATNDSLAVIQEALSGALDEKQPVGDYVEEGDERLTDQRTPAPHALLSERHSNVLDLVPEDSQGLIYDATQSKWRPGTLQSVGTIARTRKAAYICGGTNGTKTGITQMNTRHVIRLAAKTTRWRLRISNTNIRDEVAGGAISLTSIHTGRHAPDSDGGWTGNMESGLLQVHGAQSLAGGAELVTGWVTDAAHQFAKYSDRVISIGFTAASSAAIATSPNKSFQNNSTSTASTLAPSASTLTNESPLSIVVEYDFQGEQEVGLFMGDSITDGAVTVRGVASTYANQFAQAHDCLSIVHAAGGSQAQNWVVSGYKWNRLPLADMDIDFAVISLGTNDLGGGNRTPAQLKANLLTIIQRLKGLGIKKIFFGRITPRRDPSSSAGWDSIKEGYRQEMNDWMGTFPADTHGSIFFDHAVRSPTDETQLASEFLTDVLHPDTSGHGRMAAELTHALRGSSILSGPQGLTGERGPEGGGAAQYEVRRYLAAPFTNTTASKSSGFDTAVLANPQVVIPALGPPPSGYEWRIDVEGNVRYLYSVAASVGFCVAFNGQVSNALVGQDYATANQQDVVPLASFGMVPPSTSSQITIDFTAYASAAGNLTIYQTLRPKATCYLVAV